MLTTLRAARTRGDARLATVLVTGLVVLGESQVWLGWHDGGVGAVPSGDQWWRAVLCLLTVVPLGWRRARPWPSAVLVAGGVAVQALTFAYVPLLAGLVPLLVTTFSVAAYAGRVRPLVLLVDLAAVVAIVAAIPEERTTGELVFTVVVVLGTWVAGDVVRSRLSAAVAEATLGLAEQERLHLEALGRERARIARELHDVIAHSVGVMGVQAGAARTLLGSDPEAARTALLAVEDTARESVAELQRLLALLREDAGPADRSPQPGLGDLPSLVDRMRETGLRVSCRLEEGIDDVSPGLDLAAYRIVQESLTNALKHGGGEASVEVARSGGALVVRVCSRGGDQQPSIPVPRGHGLVGMRERAHLYGGTFSAGPVPGGFLVQARLPLDVAERGAVR